MASNREQLLMEMFWTAAGPGWRGVLADILGLPLEENQGTTSAAAAVKRSGNSATGGTSRTPAWQQAMNYASLGTVPLAKALIGLFTGGSQARTEEPLVRFALPRALQFEAAVSEGGVRGVGYDQFGMPRASGDRRDRMEGTPAREPALSGGEPDWPAAADSPNAREAPQVNIHVQALDRRAILDRSDEIAQAVREAILNTHALTDVVSEL